MPLLQRPFSTLAILLTLSGATAIAQPTLPRDRAPAIPAAIRSLVDRLYSSDPKQRAEAACQLGRRPADAASAIPILLSMLSDDVTVPALECEMSPWLRRTLPISADARNWMETSPAKEAAEALGEIEDMSAVDGLSRALKDSDWRVRKTAAWALGEIADPTAIDHLRAAAFDSNGEVRRAISQALRELRHK